MNIVRSVKRICAGALVVCAVAGVAAAQTPQEEICIGPDQYGSPS